MTHHNVPLEAQLSLTLAILTFPRLINLRLVHKMRIVFGNRGLIQAKLIQVDGLVNRIFGVLCLLDICEASTFWKADSLRSVQHCCLENRKPEAHIQIRKASPKTMLKATLKRSVSQPEKELSITRTEPAILKIYKENDGEDGDANLNRDEYERVCTTISVNAPRMIKHSLTKQSRRS